MSRATELVISPLPQKKKLLMTSSLIANLPKTAAAAAALRHDSFLSVLAAVRVRRLIDRHE